MIGSLLFYGLYPLTRYFHNRSSETSKKALSPALINGKVCDGGCVPTKKFTKSQTALLDQWLSPSSGPRGQPGEGLKKQAPGNEGSQMPDMDKEQSLVLHEKTKNVPVLKNGEVQSAMKEEEPDMSDGGQRDVVEAPMQEEKEMPIYCEELDMKQNIEKESSAPAEMISPAQHLQALLEISAEVGIPEAACPLEGQTPGMEEPGTPAQAAFSVMECWDEYMIVDTDKMDAGASGPKLDLASLLAENPSHPKESLVQFPETGWHVPVDPGLKEVEDSPLWQLPAMSYYPPLQQTLHCSYYPPLPSEGVWRVWEELSEIATAADAAQSSFPDHEALFDFTVMSYNVLAQDLLEANQELYSHCPLEVLNWSYRCHLLIEEIQKYAPDILCLQEVQENHYMEQLLPVLSQMGYTCVYKRRTGTKTDGCATCYRGNRFSELSVSLLEFRRVETGLLDRDNVGIVLLLQPVVTQGSEVRVKASPLCVANTHLLFNPRRGDVKLAQLAIVLAEINNIVESCMATGDQCNVILCGDFNAVPQMPLYQLITTGQLFYHGLAAWMISGQEDLSYKAHHYRLFAPLWPSSLGITDTCQYSTGKEKLPSQTQESESSRENQPYVQRFRRTLRHGLDLRSAHEHTLPGSGQSEVTTLHSEVGATVDYIFYTPKHVQKDDGQLVRGGLKMIGRLSLLSEEDLWAMRGLPNEIFPSDHLSLLAKFRLDLSPA